METRSRVWEEGGARVLGQGEIRVVEAEGLGGDTRGKPAEQVCRRCWVTGRRKSRAYAPAGP